MGFESRHRNDSPEQAEQAEQAVAGDPQARPVRRGFALLVAEDVRATPTAAKRALLEAPQDVAPTWSTTPHGRWRSAPGLAVQVCEGEGWVIAEQETTEARSTPPAR